VTLNGPNIFKHKWQEHSSFPWSSIAGFSNKLEGQKGEGDRSKRLEHFLTKKATVT
jgi:hypothetical protein